MKAIKYFLFASAVSFLLVLVGYKNDKNCVNKWVGKKIGSIAQYAGKDVCIASQPNAGENCRAVFVFEENHLSVSGQIEQAIAFVRLHEKYGLRDIGLEAYLKNQADINSEWFVNAAKGDTKSQINVAVTLLKEGEINAAEFMKLVYNDIRIHKIEKEGDYNITVDDKSTTAPILFLYRIAMTSVNKNDISKIESLSKEFENIPKNAKDKIQAKANELLEFVVLRNPWTSVRYNRLKNDQNASIDETLKLYKEIESKAVEEVKDLTLEERKQMSNLAAFYKARNNANVTMTESVAVIPQTAIDSLFALIIGAAHTKGICERLVNMKTPFVVMTPISKNKDEKTGSLDYATSYKRKMNKKSVCNDSYIEVLNSIFHKKPPPVLNEFWFQAKGEIYLFIDRINRSVLGPPPNIGLPPYGFKPDDFKGKWISIDPLSITIIDDDNSGVDAKAVLFELTIKHQNSNNQTKMWVKSGLNNKEIPGSEVINIDKLLQNALSEVKSREKVPLSRAESKGRINISIKTIAAIASTKEEVMQISLGAI